MAEKKRHAVSAVIARSKAEGSTKLILVLLANRVRPNGKAWPSLGLLAHESGLTDRAVRKSLRRLEELGDIRTEREKGFHGANVYTILVPLDPCQECGYKGCEVCGHASFNGWQKGDPKFNADELSQEPEPEEWRHPTNEPRNFSTGDEPRNKTTGVESEPRNFSTRTPEHSSAKLPKEPLEEPKGKSLSYAATPQEKATGDPLFEALVAGIGIEPATKEERSQYLLFLAQLKTLQATPEEIVRRCEHYRMLWPDMALTPRALVKHWSRLAEPPKPRRHGPSANAMAGADGSHGDTEWDSWSDRKRKRRVRPDIPAEGIFGDGGWDSWSDKPAPKGVDF